MVYSTQSNKRDAPDITVEPKSRQALFSVKLKPATEPTEFGIRLREAFGGISNTEIAEKLDVQPSSVTDYMKGKTLPPPKKLITISELTNCNLHWLLTGEGDPGGKQFDFLSESTQKIIQALADRSRIEFVEMLDDLIFDALAQRASELFANLSRLNQKDRQELMLLSDLLKAEDEGRLRKRG